MTTACKGYPAGVGSIDQYLLFATDGHGDD